MDNGKQTLQNIAASEKIIKDDNRSHIHNRLEEWKANVSLYDNDYLNRIKNAMHKVFCEESPEFDIPKERRAFALSDNKKTIYSSDLREGLAIELALIGNNHTMLVDCDVDLREKFSSDIIHDVFEEMTWKRLATLDSTLPFFAEAAPDAFLQEMFELTKNKELFAQMLSDEGDLFQGGFHWGGIVRALETLAFEEQYLSRTVTLAADLIMLDKQDNNIHPRPQDVLAGVFWPYMPQTCASPESIIAAAGILIHKDHQLGWNVLTGALDAQIGSFHRMPQVRKTIPVDFNKKSSFDNTAYQLLKKGYETLLLETASGDISLILPLSRRLERIKNPEIFNDVLEILASENILVQSDDFKEQIWTELRQVCVKHHRFHALEWAMNEEKLKEINKTIQVLEPKTLFFQKKYLFDGNEWDWHESDNYELEEEKFRQSQISAAKEFFDQYSLFEIIDFLKYIKAPGALGMAMSLAKISLEQNNIAFLLGNLAEHIQGFIGGYLWQSYHKNEQMWLATFKDVKWGQTQKITFLCHLPFIPPVWHFCEQWLGDNERLYWQMCRFRPIVSNDVDSSFAVNKALMYDRPDIAVECFYWDHHYKKNIDFDRCAKALLELSTSKHIEKIDHWEITELISNLQKQVMSPEQQHKLIQIEFLYLPLLDTDTPNAVVPATIDSALASDPEFFHEILTIVYKSESEENQEPISGNEDMARNAFRLLFQWKKIPGFVKDNWNYEAFLQWYNKVVALCAKSGHLKIAQNYIGNTLFYTPKDASGLWIDRRIALLLNQEDSDRLRNGFFCEAFNSRGVVCVDFSGKEDFEIAKGYREKADALKKEGFLIFANTLYSIATSFENDAQKNIEEGKRRERPEEL